MIEPGRTCGRPQPNPDGHQNKALEYLASRLLQAGGGELEKAAKLIRSALSQGVVDSPSAQHALFNAVWTHATSALDLEAFHVGLDHEVEALQAEMAGRVLSYRLAMGWLVRAPGAPTDFPTYDEAVRSSGLPSW